MRVLPAAVIAASLGWLTVAVVVGIQRSAHWTDLADADDLEEASYVPEHGVFVVKHGSNVLALSAISPHRPEIAERLFYCPTGYFVGPHGELFGRSGRYVDGVAPRGMDGSP